MRELWIVTSRIVMYFWMALMIAGTTHTYFTGWSQWAVLLVSSLIMVHFLMASIDKGAQS